MKTFSPKPQDVERKWYVIDAEDQVLGRLAARIAQVARGKHKPIWAPHADVGDYVIVINADKVRVTGKKMDQKMYYHHTGYNGGLRSISFRDLQSKRPEFIIQQAVKGMLPGNRLGRKLLKHVKIYASAEHPHTAQQPETLTL